MMPCSICEGSYGVSTAVSDRTGPVQARRAAVESAEPWLTNGAPSRCWP
jgi:hypothetical protein